ncbi:PLD nuclease N-terminal domain-containing protein [Compostimonas suwonensis]|uniref:Phospholipase D-like protein n=1 Tax=Compostimonas suwonensis TaxID=1048394 RepID=A0A2M9BYX6_9MICO|nr:PLD nuclease N-terminal domain-containing protein [Compostimonas suwonensis]PJJ63291.1 phospholipase D-like protein [Compostimonas suwonensis]
MRTNLDLSTVPLVVLIGMGVLLLIQIALAVVALVNLYRRPAATVATGNKWVWVVVIVLFSFIGPILYFAIGRKQEQAVDHPVVEQRRSSADIADALYTDEKPRQP